MPRLWNRPNKHALRRAADCVGERASHMVHSPLRVATQLLTQPNLPNGQASNPGSSFQVAGQPPTMPWRGLYPDLFARPDAQGIPGPLWEMNHVEVNHQGGDDLQVVIHFRKMRPS